MRLASPAQGRTLWRVLRWLPMAVLGLVVGCEDTRVRLPQTEAEPEVGQLADGGVDTAQPAAVDAGLDLATSDAPSPADPGALELPDVEAAAELVDVADVATPDAAIDSVDVPVTPLLPRTCTLALAYDAFGQDVASVTAPGEFNQWSTTALALTKGVDGVFRGELDYSALAPGSYGYKLYVTQTGKDQGDWLFDPQNPMRKTVGSDDNSKLLVPNCAVPLLEVETLHVDGSAGQIDVVVRARDGQGSGGAVLPKTAKATLRLEPLAGANYDAAAQTFNVHLKGLPAGKHTLTFDISSADGAADTLFLPIWLEPKAFSWRDAMLYFVMTDRFRDGDPAVGTPADCLPKDSKANWLGGDWKGVTQSLEEGYFTKLGINALWLTAVVDNPDGCYNGQSDGKGYASYHGYFPSANLVPENHLGTLEDLRALVRAAHVRGIRVLVDLVANHLHQEHPLAKEHAGDPQWFNAFFQCGFDEAPLTCWFEPYLPDLNYAQDATVEAMSEAALYWARAADLDGFRIDAVKHMHTNFLLTVREKLRRHVETVPGVDFYLVGETFAGDWGGGQGPNEQNLKKYIGPTLLHGQFDFPAYWPVVRAFARGESPIGAPFDVVQQSAGFYGPGAIMSRFLGNHDVPRFISHASGQIGDVWGNGAKQQGWANPPWAPTDVGPYRRLGLAWAFLFTMEGVPLVYYGDEIGLPGAGDPDNRRMMTLSGWTDHQKWLFDRLAALAKVRASTPALRSKDLAIAGSTADAIAYTRGAASKPVVIALNRGASATTFTVNVGEDGTWTDALGGGAVTSVGKALSVTVPALEARVLVP